MGKRVVAICGKGGVGKTTITALLARHLRGRPGSKALFVDADHAGGLGMALGLTPRKTIDNIRRQTIDAVRAGDADRAELAMSLDFLVTEALVEKNNLAFLSIGRPEDPGCYCAVNRLLRDAVELLAAEFDITVIDAEAGIEQVNRQVMRRLDDLVLVSDTSAKGLRVAEAIAALATSIAKNARVHLVLNRLLSPEEALQAGKNTTLEIAGAIAQDGVIRRFDAEMRPFFELPDSEATQAVAELFSAIESAGLR